MLADVRSARVHCDVYISLSVQYHVRLTVPLGTRSCPLHMKDSIS
jgi:hypothetical protein